MAGGRVLTIESLTVLFEISPDCVERLSLTLFRFYLGFEKFYLLSHILFIFRLSFYKVLCVIGVCCQGLRIGGLVCINPILFLLEFPCIIKVDIDSLFADVVFHQG